MRIISIRIAAGADTAHQAVMIAAAGGIQPMLPGQGAKSRFLFGCYHFVAAFHPHQAHFHQRFHILNLVMGMGQNRNPAGSPDQADHCFCGGHAIGIEFGAVFPKMLEKAPVFHIGDLALGLHGAENRLIAKPGDPGIMGHHFIPCDIMQIAFGDAIIKLLPGTKCSLIA